VRTLTTTNVWPAGHVVMTRTSEIFTMALYATGRHRGRQERARRVHVERAVATNPLARWDLDATRVRSRTQNGAWRRNDVDDGEREILDHESVLVYLLSGAVPSGGERRC
jgi:hypothetical protein